MPRPARRKPRTDGRRLVAALVVLGVAFALLLVAVFFTTVPQLNQLVQGYVLAAEIPADLRHASFLGAEGGYLRVYHVSWGSLAADPTATVSVAAATAPDGSGVVYAQQLGDRSDPADSAIYIRHSKDASTTLAAVGTSPAYLDATHLIYVTQAGIATRDLSDNASALLYAAPQQEAAYLDVAYAPDRTLMAWTDAAGKTVVARISPSGYQPLRTYADVPAGAVTSAGLYAIRQTQAGSELWRYPLDGSAPRKVLTFPASYAIRALVL